MENSTKSFKALSDHLSELLETESYSKSTIKDINFILRAFTIYMEINCLKVYTPEIGEQFVSYCDSDLHICASRIYRAKNITEKFNRLLQGLDGIDALLQNGPKILELPDNLAKSLEDYLAHCAEKGNRQTTINYKHWICGRFIKNLADLGCKKIQDVTGEKMQEAFLSLGCTRYWERIGPFLRFLFDKGFIEQNYSALMRRPHVPMPQPTVYSLKEIICVESSFDLSSPSGIRNYAITLLMARYGIRAGDVAALTFDNIDFENNRLCFQQQKTGDPWEAELFPEVKTALQTYMENIRPNVKGCSNVFISLNPPYSQINSGTINTMVVIQFQRTKIDISQRKHGSRAFRSSIASNMINDGVSTEVVRKVLGHGTKYALKHYARIDVESMRLCPIPVLEPTGAFSNILYGKGDLSRV